MISSTQKGKTVTRKGNDEWCESSISGADITRVNNIFDVRRL
ncbi:MAG: hypothetical protein ABIN89_21255 [Chitinophagaceae bacterium]